MHTMSLKKISPPDKSSDVFYNILPFIKQATLAALELLQKWHERASTRHQLRNLDEHCIRDIGLTKNAAESEAHKPFWK